MATDAPEKTRRVPAWLELILLLAVALAISVVIKTFVLQMFFVPSESMEPLFIEDDRILVQKISYWSGDVQRGDVVVFEDPGGWLDAGPELGPVQKALSVIGLYPAGGHLVKRVVAVGGDQVVCCDARGRVMVNGVALQEGEYLGEGVNPSDRRFDVKVPRGRLWLMGDNRLNSQDSRYHQDLRGMGTISVDRVVGRVAAIVWPASRIQVIGRPETFDQMALDE